MPSTRLTPYTNYFMLLRVRDARLLSCTSLDLMRHLNVLIKILVT
uniref:Uncharacterized protein n=1 Tax=Arundo donax TaxID=35708 RepID=A0A0A8ZF25_ARUDO